MIPLARRASRWSRRRPATWTRSSLSSHSCSQRVCQRHWAHCALGADSVGALVSMARSSASRRRRAYGATSTRRHGCSALSPVTTTRRWGGDALQRRQPRGVHGHLEQGRDLQPAGELGVGDVVGPAAEVAGAVGAQEEVGVPDPLARRRTSPGRRRRRPRAWPAASPPRRRRRPSDPKPSISVTDRPWSAQRLEVVGLVGQALGEDEVEGVVGAVAPRSLARASSACRSRVVMWAQATCLVRSVGLSTRRPSTRCMPRIMPSRPDSAALVRHRADTSG